MLKITEKELDKKLELFERDPYSSENPTNAKYCLMFESEKQEIKEWFINEFDVEIIKPAVVLYMDFNDGAWERKVYYARGLNTTNKSKASNYRSGSRELAELVSQGWKIEEV